ncbi:MAG: hypothetical protein WCO73_06410 [Verrucomicrobiota bacterium]
MNYSSLVPVLKIVLITTLALIECAHAWGRKDEREHRAGSLTSWSSSHDRHRELSMHEGVRVIISGRVYGASLMVSKG